MGTPMYVSVLSGEGYRAMLLRPNGIMFGEVPGNFATKAASDDNAKRFIGRD